MTRLKNEKLLKRSRTTKEERLEACIKPRLNGTRSPSPIMNSLSRFMQQDNFRDYMALICKKSFEYERMDEFNETVFDKNVDEYLKLSLEYHLPPTIATACLYLGVNRESLYDVAANPNHPLNYNAKRVINLCKGFTEVSALSGEISPAIYTFISKNYYGMKDTTTVEISPHTSNTSVNTARTMKIIEEQLSQEADFNPQNVLIETPKESG